MAPADAEAVTTEALVKHTCVAKPDARAVVLQADEHALGIGARSCHRIDQVVGETDVFLVGKFAAVVVADEDAAIGPEQEPLLAACGGHRGGVVVGVHVAQTELRQPVRD